MAMVLVLRPNMASLHKLKSARLRLIIFVAEFRGPGARNHFDDSPDEYELDLDRHNHSFREKAGRIILLGDGTDFPADSGDDDMFDHTDEDEDLESQVKKESGKTSNASTRNTREETPAPTSHQEQVKETRSERSTIKPAIDGVETTSSPSSA